MKTVGRWPWRLESAKKRVITYLSNLRLPKMDGAYLQYEALNTRNCVVDWQHLCREVYERLYMEHNCEQILEVVALLSIY